MDPNAATVLRSGTGARCRRPNYAIDHTIQDDQLSRSPDGLPNPSGDSSAKPLGQDSSAKMMVARVAGSRSHRRVLTPTPPPAPLDGIERPGNQQHPGGHEARADDFGRHRAKTTHLPDRLSRAPRKADQQRYRVLYLGSTWYGEAAQALLPCP